MIYYNFKPQYISKCIENFKIRVVRFEQVQKKLDFFNDYIYKESKALRSDADGLRRERSKYHRYVSVHGIFKIFTKNSVIPDYILGKKLLVHRGDYYYPVRFFNKKVVTTKIGRYIRTKRMGKFIHVNNKITQKLLKKKKQLLSMTLQRQARKRKVKMKSKSLKKKK